jgi:peptidoglycan/xylan/chitin deacetylase (PgdA/CDA1 family)
MTDVIPASMSFIKRQLLRVIATPRVAASFAPLTAGRVTILMLHRFQHEDRGVSGDDPRMLLSVLAYLRRHRYELVSLGEVFERLKSGAPPLRRAVAFTIDDGYADHAEIAAPVFAEFDCPVTTFVTSGFLDGDLWFWWDRIEYLFQTTSLRSYWIEVAEREISAAWTDAAGLRAAQAEFTERCKLLPDADKHTAIASLAAALSVELPELAPARYAPMSWDQLRACERSGMTFGPHTVTHPVLARATDEQAEFELVESWRRLREQASSPVPIFCYPNGQEGDFGPREIRLLRQMGLTGAVVGTPGHASVRAFHADADAPFKVRRIAYPGDLPTLVQYVSGFETLKQTLRREAV